jgi:hypothetical protein
MKCTQCDAQFEYIPGTEQIYERFDAQTPTRCLDCRRRRHTTFRNERNLFYNKSDKSGRQVISIYPPSSPFKIIDQDEWWDDSFDATIYAQDFDFNRPFFEQFKEFQRVVPRWSRIFVNCENSEFTNNSANVKDSYLTVSSYNSEKLFYCTRVTNCNTCLDCMNVKRSEYCSQCMDLQRCYNVHFSQSSKSCSDSYFLYDCHNCSDCILCAQLRNEKYMIENKQYSKEEYKKRKEEFLKNLGHKTKIAEDKLENLKKQVFYKNMRLTNAENSVGDFINDSKNIKNGFYVSDCEDCINVCDSTKLKDCYDNYANEESELCLEVDTSYELYNSKFCTYVISTNDSAYIEQCSNMKDCFACIGIKHGQYLIFNKKYSREEYEKLMVKIKAHMQSTGEWGLPFPNNLTPFAYNITLAFEDYPLSKEEALKQGYMWHDEKESKASKGVEIPYNINKVDESICEKTLICEETGKPFKIIIPEFKFYKTHNLPLPRISPDQRYKKLRELQPPKKLHDDQCMLCRKEIQTVYPKESDYKVVCEECYLEKVY